MSDEEDKRTIEELTKALDESTEQIIKLKAILKGFGILHNRDLKPIEVV